MKKILLALSMLAVFGTANAQWHHHHGGYYRGGGYYSGGNWVAPLIIGGIAGAVIARETAPVIIQQPPVIVQSPIYVNPEIRYIDGIAYRVQIMNINGVNQEVLVRQ
jgi:hypothetical protein